jgi:hypothetical protein
MELLSVYVKDKSFLKNTRKEKAVCTNSETVCIQGKNVLKKKAQYGFQSASEEILANLLPKSIWEYSGSGTWVLRGRCPDFVNVNGRKQVIELFGDYFHSEDEVQPTITHYESCGFTCLIVWENELRNPDLTAVIDKFTNCNTSFVFGNRPLGLGRPKPRFLFGSGKGQRKGFKHSEETKDLLRKLAYERYYGEAWYGYYCCNTKSSGYKKIRDGLLPGQTLYIEERFPGEKSLILTWDK